MRSKKTRRFIRRLAREAHNRTKPSGEPASEAEPIPTAELVEEGGQEASTRLDRPFVPSSQAETATVPAMPGPAREDPNAETEGPPDSLAMSDGPKDPPLKIPFSCPCGVFLTAPRELYDKRMRCSSCGEILLLNLLYKADLQRFEIFPLRATPEA